MAKEDSKEPRYNQPIRSWGGRGGDAHFGMHGGSGGSGKVVRYPRHEDPKVLASVIEQHARSGGNSTELYKNAFELLQGNYDIICAALRQTGGAAGK